MTSLLERTDPGEWRIIDELYPSLRRFAAVAAPLDMDPDDLLQEALVRVLSTRALSELDRPSAYLQRAMLNVAASHSRRMGRWRRVLSIWAGSRQRAADPVYPTDIADLYLLPPRERAALYLHEVEGFRYAEVAQMLGCSEQAAKKAGARGRKRLHAQLIREGA